jgi:hypothetical protein
MCKVGRERSEKGREERRYSILYMRRGRESPAESGWEY